MSDDANPLDEAVEQALDAFVYAPIGLLFDGPALFPTLVEKGRNQVRTARMMGEMAVQMGQGEATQRVSRAHDHLIRSLSAMGVVSRPAPDGPAPGDGATATEPEAPPEEPAAPVPPAPPVESLDIPDYDSLSASQVVSRLRGLESEELEAVRAYESATRARKTILSKISQLQKD